MASDAGFTLVSLLIQPTTLKSKSHVKLIGICTQCFGRILLASIRDKGLCPCVWCQIPKDQVQNLGMLLDWKQHSTLRRLDDAQRRGRVSSAWKLIYENNMAVNSAAVERLLQPDSLVPTSVSFDSLPYFYENWPDRRMLSRRNWTPLVFVTSTCWLLMYSMSLSLEFGKLCSNIFCACWNR